MAHARARTFSIDNPLLVSQEGLRAVSQLGVTSVTWRYRSETQAPKRVNLDCRDMRFGANAARAHAYARRALQRSACSKTTIEQVEPRSRGGSAKRGQYRNALSRSRQSIERLRASDDEAKSDG